MDVALEKLVHEIGETFKNMALHGLQHRSTEAALDASHQFLADWLLDNGRLALSVNDSALIVNGESVEVTEGPAKIISGLFHEYSINALSFDDGVTLEEYILLFSVFTYSPAEVGEAGGLGEVLADEGIQTIRSQKLSPVQISDDELVVESHTAPPLMTVQEQETQGSRYATFLRGGIELVDEDLAAFKDASQDLEQFSDLIISAATDSAREIRKDHEPSGEEFVQAIVGCLQRACSGLMRDASYASQKGKRELSKAVQFWEQNIVTCLRDADIGITGKELKGITRAAEELEDDIRMDALAAEYCKKRSASQSSEQKLVRYLKRKGSASGMLKEKLIEGGITPGAWQDLLIESGVREERMDGEADAPAPLQQLEGMIGELNQAANGAGSVESAESRLQLKVLMTQIEAQVADCVADTEERVNVVLHELARSAWQEARNDGLSAEQLLNQPRPMPRKEMMIRLAKLTREVCQPLDVMDSIIEAIRVGDAGKVSEAQSRMLGFAAKSSGRLRGLIDYVEKVSKDPRTFEMEEG